MNSEFVKRVNNIAKQNKIVLLQRENEQKDETINMLSKESRKIIDEFGQKSKQNIDQLNDRIKALEEESLKIKQERNYYKEMLESIPSFIRKLFVREKKSITE